MYNKGICEEIRKNVEENSCWTKDHMRNYDGWMPETKHKNESFIKLYFYFWLINVIWNELSAFFRYPKLTYYNSSLIFLLYFIWFYFSNVDYIIDSMLNWRNTASPPPDISKVNFASLWKHDNLLMLSIYMLIFLGKQRSYQRKQI